EPLMMRRLLGDRRVRARLTVAVAGLLASCAWLPTTRLPLATSASYVAGKLLVGFNPTATTAQRHAAQLLGQAISQDALLKNDEEWTLARGASAPALAESLAQQPGVKFAQPDYIRHLQAYTASELASGESLLWHLQLIGIDQAWSISQPAGYKTFDAGSPPGKGVLVAVVDSGVDVRHPDLAGNIARDASGNILFYDEIHAQGSTDVWTPPAGPPLDYDWTTAYQDAAHPGPDGNGHGTHVAGILAAVGNNNPGISCKSPPCNTVGTAPGVTILPVKTMRADGSGDDATIAHGLRDAADAGAKIINLSVGGPEPSPLLADVMAYDMSKGALLVIASGNDGLAVNYPAAYAGALAVGAVGDPADPGYPRAMAAGAPYSSHGPQLGVVAPGGSATTACPESRCGVYSTVPMYPCFLTLTGKVASEGYGRLTGTSMATPIVSGVAAMILEREPTLSPAQLRERILAATTPVPGTAGGFSDPYGYGLIDPAKAMTQVSPDGS
ncbi:MAG: S8 family serine peptidase, partial [Cyanobacteria bacterium REEB65]|nr:S8 family serine peptidase [Cyanobacteria bacterium REEB65]